MFERPHHCRIAAVLEALDADVLKANAFLFGGGTAMALRYGEYRESADIDFLVSKVDGYRHLRQRLSGPDGMSAITRAGHTLEQTREVRADQYGIRTMLQRSKVSRSATMCSRSRVPAGWPVHRRHPSQPRSHRGHDAQGG